MPPWLLPLLFAGGSGLLSAFGGSKTESVGKAEDVKNINPMTGDMYNALMGMLQQYNPESNLNAMKGANPIIQDLVNGFMAPYATNAEQSVKLAQQDAINTISQNYASEGALHSGPALAAIAKGVATPATAMATDLSKFGAGMMQDLLARIMGERAGFGSQALSGATSYGAPEWWQPTYKETEDPLSKFLKGFMPMAGVAAGKM